MLNDESLKIETVKEEHVKQIQNDLPNDSNRQVVDASNAESVPSGSNRKRRRHNLISPEKDNKKPKQEKDILDLRSKINDLKKDKETVNQEQPGSRLRSLSSSSSESSDDGPGSRSRSSSRSSSSSEDKDSSKLDIDKCIKNSKKHYIYMKLLKSRMAEEKKDYELSKEVNDNLKNEKEELTKENSILKDKNDGLKGAIEDLEKEKERQTNDNSKLKKDLIQEKERYKQLNKKLDTLKKNKEVQMKDNSELKEEIERFKKQIKYKDSKKTDLMKIMNIPIERRDYESLKKAIEDLKDEKEKQTKDNSKKKKEIERLKINRLEQKNDLMNIMNIPKERRDYETLKRAIEDLKEEKEKQKRDNLETFNNCIELTSQHSDLMEIMEIPQKERNYESLRNSIVNLKNEKEKQTIDNSKLKDENDKLNTNIAKLESFYDMQEQDRENLCEIMKISKEEGDYEALKKAIEDLKNKKEEQTRHNSKLKETNDELKEICEKLELKQSDLMMIMNIPFLS